MVEHAAMLWTEVTGRLGTKIGEEWVGVRPVDINLAHDREGHFVVDRAEVRNLISISTVLDSASKGIDVVGAVQGGFPPIGLPQGVSMSNMADIVGIAFSCFILIIAQSATPLAASR